MKTPSVIIRDVAAHFGIEPADIRSPSKLPTALRARRLVVYVLRMKRGLTYGEIARALGAGDKANVQKLYIRAQRSPDPDVALFLGP